VRKCIPFEFDTPTYGVDPVSIAVQDCADIEEITLVNSRHFEQRGVVEGEESRRERSRGGRGVA
jgi:hypothetical protein